MVGEHSTMLLERRAESDPERWLGRIHNGHYALVPHRPGFAPGLAVPVALHGWNGRELLADDLLDDAARAELAAQASEPAAATFQV